MPVYEFECTSCPSHFELKRSFHDDDPVSCPSCGSKARRVFCSVPIIFKGSGFYVTDSRGGSSYTSAPAPSAETAGAAETKTATETKAEAKDSPAESKTS